MCIKCLSHFISSLVFYDCGKILVIQFLLVDASQAGPGNLEVVVRSAKDGSRIPNYLEADDHSGKFRIYFTPHPDCFNYQVDVAFNDEPVTGVY